MELYDFYLIDSDSNPVLLDENKPASPNTLLDSMAPGVYNFVVTKAGEAPQAGAWKQEHWVVGPAATPAVEYGKNEITVVFERPDFSRRTRLIMQEGADGPGRTVLMGTKTRYTSNDSTTDRYKIQGEGMTPEATGQMSDWVIVADVAISDIILNTPVRNPDGTVTLTWTGGDATGGLPVHYDIEVLAGENTQLIPVPLEDGKAYTFSLSETASLKVRAYCGFATAESAAAVEYQLSVTKVFGTLYNKSFAILDNGDLYACGDNNEYGLGLPEERNYTYYTKVPGISNVVDVQGYRNVTAVLTEDGSVFVVGNNVTFGGHTHFTKKYDGAANGAATKISLCGSDQNDINLLILNAARQLWGIGANTYGQLGVGHTNPVLNISAITGAVADMQMGRTHAIMLQQSSPNAFAVLTCGMNNNGRTGQNTTTGNQATWKAVSFSGTAPTITASTKIGVMNANCYIHVGNELYICGGGGDGIIGTGIATDRTSFVKVSMFSANGSVYTSPYARHMLATQDGELYGWGYNANGQLGTGDTTNKLLPTPLRWTDNAPIFILNAPDVIVQEVNTYILSSTADGVTVHGVGRNTYNQVHGANTNDVVRFNRSLYASFDSPIFSCSNAHIIGTRKVGDVLLPIAGGINSSGQLGITTTSGNNHASTGWDLQYPAQGINPSITITGSNKANDLITIAYRVQSKASFTSLNFIRIRDGVTADIGTVSQLSQNPQNPLTAGYLVDNDSAGLVNGDLVFIRGIVDGNNVDSAPYLIEGL